MTFSKLLEVLQEMTRPLPESPELPLTMALKNQVGGPKERGRAARCPQGATNAGRDTPSWCFPAVWDLLALFPAKPWREAAVLRHAAGTVRR